MYGAAWQTMGNRVSQIATQ